MSVPRNSDSWLYLVTDMDTTHTTFRRLADKDVAGFHCAAVQWLVKHPAWKMVLIVAVLTVCIRWITK